MLKGVNESADRRVSDASLTRNGRKRQRAKTEVENRVKKRKPTMTTAFTEYEQMRQRNIEEKKAFLDSLNIDQALEEVTQAIPKYQKVKRLKMKQEKQLVIPRPKSLRIQGLQPDASPLPSVKTNLLHQELNDALFNKPRKSSEPFSFSSVSVQKDSEVDVFTSGTHGISEDKCFKAPVAFNQYAKYFNSMKLPEQMVTKLSPDRIFSISVHPSSSRIVIGAGSKWGHIGLLSVGSSEGISGICCYEPHVRPVNCLEFCSTYPNRMYSCSYDGTFQCGDLEKAMFSQVYCTDEEKSIRCTYFDFISPETFLVGHSDGSVATLDSRTSGKMAENIYNVHLRPLKTISVNQSKTNYFITASNDGLVKLFDLRKIHEKTPSPVVELEHAKSVNSAFFSPGNGKFILCTTMEHRLKLYDSSVLDSGSIKLKHSIRHDCQTGRWLTPFRAVWLPGSEEAFIVGAMVYPRCIMVYDNKGHNIHNFGGEALASVCCINAFHASRPILVGGNSSGKVHIFIGEGVL